MAAASSTKGRRRVVFGVRSAPGSEVYVAGTFNNWSPKQKRLKDAKGDGVYSAALLLPTGRHEYKFVVNGVWSVDPECPQWVQNELGSLNSVIHVL